MISRQWASSILSVETRRLPREDFCAGFAVVVPQPSSSSGDDDEDVKPVTWTDVLEDVSYQELLQNQHIINAFNDDDNADGKEEEVEEEDEDSDDDDDDDVNDDDDEEEEDE